MIDEKTKEKRRTDDGEKKRVQIHILVVHFSHPLFYLSIFTYIDIA